MDEGGQGRVEGGCTRQDVRRLYALALGREPESEAAIDGFSGRPLSELAPIFFYGPEFADHVRRPVAESRAPAGGFFDQAPTPELLDWAVTTLPLAPATAQALRTTPSWPALYHRLFSDAVFTEQAHVSAVFTPHEREVLARFADHPERYARRAVIEEVAGGCLRGWAHDAAAPHRPVRLDLWIDSRFAGSALADRFRRDIQDRLGGDGRAGLEIPLPQGAHLRRRRYELRDPTTGLILAALETTAPAPALEPYKSVRAELQAIRSVLERLEASMPSLHATQGYALADYADYFETYYRSSEEPRFAPLAAKPEVVVLLDAAGAPPDRVEDAIWSVVEQTAAVWRLAVWGLDADGVSHLKDLRNRVRWRTGHDLIAAGKALPSYSDAAAALEAATADVVLTFDAGGVLARDALARILDAFGEGTAAVYVDEDHLDGDGAPGDLRHRDPVLKPSHDPDLLHQVPYVGPCVAFRREVLTTLGLRPQAGPLKVEDAVLRLKPEQGQVRHVARVLHSRRETRNPPEDLWRDCVRRRLSAQRKLSVVAATDVLGAETPGAARVVRPVQARTATVIVPTRDRMDLLKPCVESLIASRAANAVRMEIAVVDHQSREPATRDYLAKLKAEGAIRVDKFKGGFNWALINNLAAARSDADVLVFLNNDTLIVSPDWLDAFCAQAMRPDVGAVGARLVYEDGTLQHAGFVARGREAIFLAHDGVGLAGSDGGYLGRNALLHDTVAVTGACMAVRREVFERFGGFDAARYPVEGNDVDLCLRLQAGGLKVLYEPAVTLHHLESKSRGFSVDGDKRAVTEAAARILWAKWGDRFGRDPRYNAHFDREARPFTRLRPPR